MKINKIGMRTIKTAFAVVLTIGFAQMINLRSPFFAGIAAIMAMQTSVSQSLIKGKDRMYGTITGGIIALVFSIVAPEKNIIIIGVGIIIIIYLSNMLKWKESTQISMIVYLSIMLNFDAGSRFSYVFNRILDTLIGLIIGTIINYFIVPPKTGEKINIVFSEIDEDIKNTLNNIVFNKPNISLEPLRKQFVSLEDSYNTYKKDYKYNKYNLKSTENISNTQKVFDLFEDIYNHLGVIYLIGKNTKLNIENRETLQKIFNKEILVETENIDEHENIVYNYHLRKILDNLSSIEEINTK